MGFTDTQFRISDIVDFIVCEFLNIVAKVAIGVVVPAVAITSFLLGTIYLRRRRRKEGSSDKGKSAVADSSEDTQPYLQQKAELEAKETRQLELDAQQLHYEMDGSQTRYEVEGAETANQIFEERREPGKLGLAHELRGEEHSKELEGSKIK